MLFRKKPNLNLKYGVKRDWRSGLLYTNIVPKTNNRWSNFWGENKGGTIIQILLGISFFETLKYVLQFPVMPIKKNYKCVIAINFMYIFRQIILMMNSENTPKRA